ncbi:MAG: MBL fold metallo-hydrolase [Bacteroidales bacterium]|nr:MBL fold metallo-hydrolase [Bacteroidales bacterium]
MSKLFYILLLVFFAASCHFDSSVTLTFYGGAEEIGGSCALLNIDTTKILIDCGSYLYEEENEQVNFRAHKEFMFDPQKIHYLLLTHAHMDHCGKISQLYRSGFSGKLYTTNTTASILQIALQNQILYDPSPRRWIINNKKKYTITAHWNNCYYSSKIKNRINFNGSLQELKNYLNYDRIFPCKECTKIELNQIFTNTSTISYAENININDNISIQAIPTFHIPGAAAFLVNITTDITEKSIIFSGDIGNDIKILYNYYQPFPKADFVIIEGTYGNKERNRNYEQQLNEFINDVSNQLRQNKIVWIPSFALDRTQKILYVLNKAKSEGKLPIHYPIYVPSPTAQKYNNIYSMSNIKNEFTDNFEPHFLQNYFPHLPSHLNGPCILITTSGMMNFSYSKMLLPFLLPRRDVFLCFVGFQSKGTPGWQIINNKNSVSFDGKEIPIYLEWKKYDLFSGHGDFIDIVHLLSQNKTSTIYLVHGEPATLKEMKIKLQQNGFSNVIIAKNNTTYQLE